MATKLFYDMRRLAERRDCSPAHVLLNYEASEDILDCVAAADELDQARRTFMGAMREVTPLRRTGRMICCPVCGSESCSRAVLIDVRFAGEATGKFIFT